MTDRGYRLDLTNKEVEALRIYLPAAAEAASADGHSQNALNRVARKAVEAHERPWRHGRRQIAWAADHD